MARIGFDVPMPDLGSDDWTAFLFVDAGRYGSTGMGPVPLTWAEIDAWARNAGTPVDPAEMRLVRSMSVAFVNGLGADEAPFETMACRMATATAQITAAMGEE